MADSLRNIEQLLQTGYKPKVADASMTPKTSDTPSTVAASIVMDDQFDDATIDTHTAVASRMVDTAVQNSFAAYQDSELAAALDHLRGIVNRIKGPDSVDRRDIAEDARELLQPPNEAELEQLISQSQGMCYSRSL